MNCCWFSSLLWVLVVVIIHWCVPLAVLSSTALKANPNHVRNTYSRLGGRGLCFIYTVTVKGEIILGPLTMNGEFILSLLAPFNYTLILNRYYVGFGKCYHR